MNAVQQIAYIVPSRRALTPARPSRKAADIPGGHGGKVWQGKAAWLQNPVKAASFTPLTREETHAR